MTFVTRAISSRLAGELAVDSALSNWGDEWVARRFDKARMALTRERLFANCARLEVGFVDSSKIDCKRFV